MDQTISHPLASVSQLEISDGDGQTWFVDLAGPPLLIGRGDSADVQLDHPTVSRQHAELFTDPFGRWWVRDMGSRNGVKINDQRVGEHLLGPADRLGIGAFTGRLHLAASTATSSAPTTTSHMAILDDQHTSINTMHQLRAPAVGAAHLSSLLEFGQNLLALEDAQQRLEALCQLMVEDQLRGQTAMALRLNVNQPEQDPQMLCEPMTSGMATVAPAHLSGSVMRAILQRRCPILASNALHDEGQTELSIAVTQQAMSVVACPLRIDDEVMDVLYVTLPPQYGTGEWLALAELAVRLYHQAEANWSLRRHAEEHNAIEQELKRALEIQAHLMPDPPQIVGLDIAISFVPCRWVGGDYVDVLTTPDGRTLLLLADVSGKGIQAALTCSSIHAMVHAAVPSDIPLPQLVSTLNDHLCRYLPQTSFVTMVCLLLDPSSGNYECVNAGHPPILVAGVDGQITELQHSANLPLGLQAMELTNQTGTIEPERLLAMYSDGLTEAMNAQNRQWGMAGLSAQLGALYKASPGKPLADLVAQLEQAVDAWQEGRLATDDRTFLLAGRR